MVVVQSIVQSPSHSTPHMNALGVSNLASSRTRASTMAAAGMGQASSSSPYGMTFRINSLDPPQLPPDSAEVYLGGTGRLDSNLVIAADPFASLTADVLQGVADLNRQVKLHLDFLTSTLGVKPELPSGSLPSIQKAAYAKLRHSPDASKMWTFLYHLPRLCDVLFGIVESSVSSDTLIDLKLITSRDDSRRNGWCDDTALMDLSDDSFAILDALAAILAPNSPLCMFLLLVQVYVCDNMWETAEGKVGSLLRRIHRGGFGGPQLSSPTSSSATGLVYKVTTDHLSANYSDVVGLPVGPATFHSRKKSDERKSPAQVVYAVGPRDYLLVRFALFLIRPPPSGQYNDVRKWHTSLLSRYSSRGSVPTCWDPSVAIAHPLPLWHLICNHMYTEHVIKLPVPSFAVFLTELVVEACATLAAAIVTRPNEPPNLKPRPIIAAMAALRFFQTMQPYTPPPLSALLVVGAATFETVAQGIDWESLSLLQTNSSRSPLHPTYSACVGVGRFPFPDVEAVTRYPLPVVGFCRDHSAGAGPDMMEFELCDVIQTYEKQDDTRLPLYWTDADNDHYVLLWGRLSQHLFKLVSNLFMMWSQSLVSGMPFWLAVALWLQYIHPWRQQLRSLVRQRDWRLVISCDVLPWHLVPLYHLYTCISKTFAVTGRSNDTMGGQFPGDNRLFVRTITRVFAYFAGDQKELVHGLQICERAWEHQILLLSQTFDRGVNGVMILEWKENKLKSNSMIRKHSYHVVLPVRRDQFFSRSQTLLAPGMLDDWYADMFNKMQQNIFRTVSDVPLFSCRVGDCFGERGRIIKKKISKEYTSSKSKGMLQSITQFMGWSAADHTVLRKEISKGKDLWKKVKQKVMVDDNQLLAEAIEECLSSVQEVVDDAGTAFLSGAGHARYDGHTIWESDGLVSAAAREEIVRKYGIDRPLNTNPSKESMTLLSQYPLSVTTCLHLGGELQRREVNRRPLMAHELWMLHPLTVALADALIGVMRMDPREYLLATTDGVVLGTTDTFDSSKNENAIKLPVSLPPPEFSLEWCAVRRSEKLRDCCRQLCGVNNIFFLILYYSIVWGLCGQLSCPLVASLMACPASVFWFIRVVDPWLLGYIKPVDVLKRTCVAILLWVGGAMVTAMVLVVASGTFDGSNHPSVKCGGSPWLCWPVWSLLRSNLSLVNAMFWLCCQAVVALPSVCLIAPVFITGPRLWSLCRNLPILGYVTDSLFDLIGESSNDRIQESPFNMNTWTPQSQQFPPSAPSTNPVRGPDPNKAATSFISNTPPTSFAPAASSAMPQYGAEVVATPGPELRRSQLF